MNGPPGQPERTTGTATTLGVLNTASFRPPRSRGFRTPRGLAVRTPARTPEVEARPGPWFHGTGHAPASVQRPRLQRPGSAGRPRRPSLAVAPASTQPRWTSQPPGTRERRNASGSASHSTKGFSTHLQARASTTPTRGRSATDLGDRPDLWQRGRRDQRSRCEADTRPEQSARLTAFP